jgi:hypothetical protein
MSMGYFFALVGLIVIFLYIVDHYKKIGVERGGWFEANLRAVFAMVFGPLLAAITRFQRRAGWIIEVRLVFGRSQCSARLIQKTPQPDPELLMGRVSCSLPDTSSFVISDKSGR